jgi:hypothetical protein
MTSILGVVGSIVNGITFLIGLGTKLGNVFGETKEMGAVLGYTLKGLIWTAGSIAAMMAFASASAVPIIGPALGFIAAAAVIGLTNSLSSKVKIGNDMVSPGYGKRTLMGPEGTIALNDKDTVIAGTNLFGDDIESKSNSSTEKFEEGKIKVGKENNIKQSSPSQPSIDYTALANAIVSALSASPMNVNVRGEINGKTLVDFIGNNATNVGTAINTGTSKIS